MSYSSCTEQNKGFPSTGSNPMQLLWSSVATLMVTVIYCAWRVHLEVQQRRSQVLRRRITFMLWVMANQGEQTAH